MGLRAWRFTGLGVQALGFMVLGLRVPALQAQDSGRRVCRIGSSGLMSPATWVSAPHGHEILRVQHLAGNQQCYKSS